MLELFGFPIGTALQGGTFVAAIAMLAIVLRAYIVGIPDRKRAENEAKVIDGAEVAMRFKEWRTEIHEMRNELAIVKAQLHKSDAQRARNKDRFNMVLFILRLVMAELRRIDPDSDVIKQADLLLKQVTDEEGDAIETGAVGSAQRTVDAAKDTLEEVKQAEGAKK